MKKIIIAIILILLLTAGWYFYPCFTFKGTYSRILSNGKERIVRIDDKIHIGDKSGEYSINYFTRSLWISPPLGGLSPMELGYNKIYDRDFKTGELLEYEKLN